VVEKFIPFIIKKINWSVSNKLVSYDFECGPIGQQIAGTTARGTIPYDIELSDSSVSGLLGGDAKYGTGATAAATPGATTTPTSTDGRATADPRRTDNATGGLNSLTGEALGSPAKASAAPTPKKTITQGLMGAMNDFQKELVKKGVYQYPDEYEIVFANGAEAIKDALITLPGKVKNQNASPMSPAASVDASSKDPARQRTDNNVRNFSITAGQQVVQAIDLAIRNSSYIYKQANIQKSEEPDPTKVEKDNEESTANENKTPATSTVLWYEITMEAIPKEQQYDFKRNDYTYIIRYIISPFVVQNFNSKFYPVPKFIGLHKQYRYWFTGENSDVLDYQATFNHLYNMTVSGKAPGDSNADRIRQKYTSSMRELTKYVYQSASSESRSGAELQANEIAANAAESLYSPSDLAKGKIKIVGDPAWIQQGSVAGGVGQSNFNYKGFLPDGTINFDSQQVMFAIEWQRPQDYDLNTGLADPYKKTKGPRKPIQSYVYQAVKCTTELRQGRFEQTIDGTLYLYPTSNLKNAATQPSNATADNVNGRPIDTNRSTQGAGAVASPAPIDNTKTTNDIAGTTPNSNAALDNAQQSAPTSDGQNVGVNIPSTPRFDSNFFDANAELQTDTRLDVAPDPTNPNIPTNQQIERDF
jgi:hypothetical protein